eukprot:gene45942-60509_t
MMIVACSPAGVEQMLYSDACCTVFEKNGTFAADKCYRDAFLDTHMRYECGGASGSTVDNEDAPLSRKGHRPESAVVLLRDAAALYMLLVRGRDVAVPRGTQQGAGRLSASTLTQGVVAGTAPHAAAGEQGNGHHVAGTRRCDDPSAGPTAVLAAVDVPPSALAPWATSWGSATGAQPPAQPDTGPAPVAARRGGDSPPRDGAEDDPLLGVASAEARRLLDAAGIHSDS